MLDDQVCSLITAAQPELSLPQTMENELLVSLYQNQPHTLITWPYLLMKLWRDATRTLAGNVLEIVPDADHVTERSSEHLVQNQLLDLKLGMTAVFAFVRTVEHADNDVMHLLVHINPVLAEDGINVLWV
ncbi:hypothetical protein [Ralstonia solanacearum]|uniref:hypothetical protein n=1 Tax=Ralstonia solanacearum TaxID=305 RepID=UPI0011D2B6D5|nr:hypothetical protein [Ralstonia solanacearum]